MFTRIGSDLQISVGVTYNAILNSVGGIIEILPNVTNTLLVQATVLVPYAILGESTLSFLGLGVQPPTPSWGEMISEGVDRITTAPHLTIVPGAMLVMTVLALNIFGDGVRDAFDPRAKVRMEL